MEGSSAGSAGPAGAWRPGIKGFGAPRWNTQSIKRNLFKGGLGSVTWGKRTTCWLLLAVVVSFLSANSEAQSTLTLLAGNQNPEVIGRAVAEFEAAHPELRVDLVLEAWNTVDDKFTVMVSSGTAPDVFINNSVYGWARYAYQGLFTDLEPFIERDRESLRWNEFFGPAIEQARIAGKLYGMPTGPAMGFGTTYNADLLNEAGLAPPPTSWTDPSWNWDVMVDYAKKLTRIDGEGRATRYGVDFWDADGNLLAVAYAFGGDWFDEASYAQGIVNQVRLDSLENARAYQAAADLRMVHQVRPGGPVGGVDGGVASFSAGHIGMWLEISMFRQTNPQAMEFTWGFAPYPFSRESDRRRIASWGGGGFAAIPAHASNKEGAWAFLKWVATASREENPGLRDWHPVGGPRQTWLEAMSAWHEIGVSSQTPDQMFEVLMGAVERAVALPRQTIAGGTEVWEVLSRALVPALRGETPVSAALVNAQALATAAVAEFKQSLLDE